MRSRPLRITAGLIGAAILVYPVVAALHASMELVGDATTTMICIDGVEVHIEGISTIALGLALVAFAAWPRRATRGRER